MTVVGGGYFDLLEFKSCLKQIEETSKKKNLYNKGLILNNNQKAYR